MTTIPCRMTGKLRILILVCTNAHSDVDKVVVHVDILTRMVEAIPIINNDSPTYHKSRAPPCYGFMNVRSDNNFVGFATLLDSGIGLSILSMPFQSCLCTYLCITCI